MDEDDLLGLNMTTLTFALSRSLARELQPGDEIVVTRLDHDANIAPWLRIAEERNCTVRWVDFDVEDCTLRLDQLEAAGGAELFEREAETWVNLGLHPHVVTCHYVRRVDGLPLVFAEYVDGGSLHDAIREHRLDSVEAALDAGERRMISFFSRVRVFPLEEPEWSSFDPDGLTFFNVNTPEELAEAERRLTGQTPGERRIDGP